MICPNCDNYYNDDFDFCPHCGTKKPEPLTCPECGFRSNEYSFCPKCGEKLRTSDEMEKIAMFEEVLMEREKKLKAIREEDNIDRLIKKVENDTNVVYIGRSFTSFVFIDDIYNFKNCKEYWYDLDNGNLILKHQCYLEEQISRDWIEDNVISNIPVDYNAIKARIYSDADERRLRNDDSYLDELDAMVEEEAYEIRAEKAHSINIDISMDVDVSRKKFNVIVNGKSHNILTLY